MSNRFLNKRLPLATAVIGILSAQVALAQDNPHVELEEVVIKLDRQGTKVQTDVVTLKEKDESTATDLRGLLKDEPAIDFSGGNGASQYLTIRGMGQNSIDVKIDNAYSDSQILYHQGRFMLDPALVKIVSVQKGAGAASAGIGATNGAIVAKTVDAYDLLKGSNKDYGFKVNVGYSSNDEHSYGLSAFGKAGNFDFLVSGNRVDQNDYTAGKGYASPVDGGKKVHYSALDKISYLAKAGIKLDDHRLVLSHFKETNNGRRNVREEFDWFDRQRPNYRELSLENTNLEYKGDLGKTGITANTYLMKNKRTSEDDTAAYGNFTGYNETYVKTQGANINFDTQATENALLRYGVNYRHQEVFPNKERVGFVHQEKTDAVGYVEAVGDIGDVTATAGVRYDYFEYTAMDGKKVSNDALNPSIGLIWQATPQLSFNTNHNYATRSPRLVDALLSGTRNVSIANNVKAERAQNTEVGFNYNNGTFSASGSYFWQSIDNLLNSGQVARHDTGNTAYYNGINNVGYAKNKGYELNAAYKWKGLTARVGVAESKPEFYSSKDAQGRNISFANREYAARLGRIWTAGVAYRFANPSLEIGINHRLAEDVTGQSAWMTQVNGNRGNDLNLVREGYNTTDVYANWKPYGNNKLNVNFAVNNITDELYRTHTASGGLPVAGREIRVGVNFTY